MVFRGLPRACCSFGGGATGSNIESLRQTNQNEREMNRAISTVPAAPLRAPPQTESAEVHASAGREAPAIAPLVGAMRSCRPVEGRSAVRRCGEETREEWLRSDALGGRGLDPWAAEAGSRFQAPEVDSEAFASGSWATQLDTLGSWDGGGSKWQSTMSKSEMWSDYVDEAEEVLHSVSGSWTPQHLDCRPQHLDCRPQHLDCINGHRGRGPDDKPMGWRRKLEDSLGCIKGEDSLPCHKRISVWMLVWEWGEADAQRWEGWQECQVSQMPLTSCPPPPPSRRRLWRTLACSACGCLAVLVPSLSSPPCRMPSPHPGTRSRPSGMRCWVCSASPAAFAHPLAHAPQRVKEEEEEGGGHKRRSSQVLEEGKKKGEEGCRHDASPAWATSPARRQAVLQPQPSAAQGSQASGALSQAAATDEHEGQGTRNAASSHDAMWTRNAASSDDAPTSPPPTSSPRQGGASSWTAAARVEASGREEGDAHQDGSNGACSATGRRRRRSAETPVQTAADACKNKNCHYCEHAPKRSAFFACLHPSCDQTFCENCNSRHLDAPTYFGGQDDASRANWLCPICTRTCCCTKEICDRDHLHCKRYRRKLKALKGSLH